MAENAVVGVLLKARDEASAEVARLSGQLGALPGALGRIASGAGPLGLIAAGAIAAGGAAVAMAKQFTDTAIALERVSRGTGASLSEVQVLQQTYERFGLGADQATTALQFMSKAISLHHVELAALGVTSRDSFQAILQLADATKKHGDAASINAELSRLLGRQWRSLAGVITELRGATEAERAEMEKAGAIMDEVGVAKAKEMRDAMEKLSVQWRGVWLQMATGMTGPATVILTFISNMLTGLGKFTDWAKGPGAHLFEKQGSIPGYLVGPEFPLVGPAASEAAAPGVSLLRDDEGDKETPREKQVKRLMALLGMGRKMAIDMAVELERLKGFKESESLKKELGLPSDEEALNAWQNLKTRGGGMPGAKAGLVPDLTPVANVAVRDIKSTAEGAFAIVLMEWQQTTDKMVTIGTIMDDSMSAVFYGLQTGVQSVFHNLVSSGQTMASAFKTIIGGIGSAVLDMMAQVVTGQLFKLFVRLLGSLFPVAGIPISVMTDFSGGGVIPGGSRSGLAGAARLGSGGGRGPLNITVQSFTALDALDQLSNPGAPLRLAFEREARAASFG